MVSVCEPVVMVIMSKRITQIFLNNYNKINNYNETCKVLKRVPNIIFIILTCTKIYLNLFMLRCNIGVKKNGSVFESMVSQRLFEHKIIRLCLMFIFIF